MRKAADTLTLSASDLVGHLNCLHLTSLDLAVVNGQIGKPEVWKDPQLELLRERGAIHESDYLKTLSVDIVRIDGIGITDDAVARTIEMMQAGKQVIVQGALSNKIWQGRVDVLRRIEVPSKLGPWSYEVIDTKLARETKGGTILQLCLYSDLLAYVQGLDPEFMYVVVPWSGFEPQQFRLHDYAAYYRRAKSSLERLVSGPIHLATYPDPKAHCDVCHWNIDCDKKIRKDDHLSLVAGISKVQINELKQYKIDAVTRLAAMPVPLTWKPERGLNHSYIRIREQARVQVEGRKKNNEVFEILLPLEPGFGFYCLPEPSEGDIFLDFEGDPHVGDSGLEYLLGYQYKGEDGQFKYVPEWALNRADEKRVFESFVDFIMVRWIKYPDMHIYHYAPYEPSALKRLMGRYATREEEIDRMLRGKLFVDLLSITRNCIRASVESYSLKKLEPFYKYNRSTELLVANRALFAIQACLELNILDSITNEIKLTIEGYNRDDCASARCLRDWLEDLRAGLVQKGEQINRPEQADGEASENITEWLAKVADLIMRLTQDIPVAFLDQTDEQHARWLLANILDWHRREQKAVWWDFFRLAGLSAEDLLDEKAGLSGLTFVGNVGGTAKSPIHRYKFRSQETEVRAKNAISALGGNKFGTVEDISTIDCTIDIKKRVDSKDIHPEAIFAHEVVNTKELANSLIRLGEYVAANGIKGEGSYQAARDLLLRELPRIGSEDLSKKGENSLEGAVRLALKLEGGIFPIQGPPGTGKTFTGARMICALVKQGNKVGITANSHKVIRNLINAVIEAADELRLDLRCVQKAAETEVDCHRLNFAESNEDLFAALNGGCQVAGGTAWLWSRQEAFEQVDVLFVDEAAQMSLANVLAVSQAGKTVVLLGDPQQLDQPMQGSHPEGTDVSALNHILGDEQTIPTEKGLFLKETWRLHPNICDFTSELFYDSKLKSKKGLEVQAIKSTGRVNGSGLRYIQVNHTGNQNSSPEEAEKISELVKEVIDSKSTWINQRNEEKEITIEDILIITPYNAQVHEIQKCLPQARVGTVDKFQGQEAPIAIYSMATSSYADAPRGMEFLYSLNRFNVATSRARCLSILVAAPQIFEMECKTPHQMRLANAFCRYLEMAQEIS